MEFRNGDFETLQLLAKPIVIPKRFWAAESHLNEEKLGAFWNCLCLYVNLSELEELEDNIVCISLWRQIGPEVNRENVSGVHMVILKVINCLQNP